MLRPITPVATRSAPECEVGPRTARVASLLVETTIGRLVVADSRTVLVFTSKLYLPGHTPHRRESKAVMRSNDAKHAGREVVLASQMK